MHIAVITICVLTEEEVSFMEERLLHIGQTDSVCLYDFALLLSAAEDVCIDRCSELWFTYHQLLSSAWGQLPEILTIDFLEPPLPSGRSQ